MLKLTREITKNPVNNEVIRDEIKIEDEGGIMWVAVSKLDDFYKAIGEKIAEMELEAGATPKTDLI